MQIAKFFRGPQDGRVLQINDDQFEEMVTFVHAADPEGAPDDLLLDRYLWDPDYCPNPECKYLHYTYESTERTTDQ